MERRLLSKKRGCQGLPDILIIVIIVRMVIIVTIVIMIIVIIIITTLQTGETMGPPAPRARANFGRV